MGQSRLAEFFSVRANRLVVAYFLLSLADPLLTLAIVYMGGAEGNPLIKVGDGVNWPLKLSLSVAVSLGMLLAGKEWLAKSAVVVMMVVCIVSTGMVYMLSPLGQGLFAAFLT